MSRKRKATRQLADDSLPPVVNISGQPSGYTKPMVKQGFGKNDSPPNSKKANRSAVMVDTSAQYRDQLTDLYRDVIASYPSADEMEAAQARADGLIPEPPDALRGVVGGNVKGVREVPMSTSVGSHIVNVSAESSLNTIREPRYAGAIREHRVIPQGMAFFDGPHAVQEPASLTDYVAHPEGPPSYGCAGNGTCAGHCGGRCSATASFAMRQARRAAAR